MTKKIFELLALHLAECRPARPVGAPEMPIQSAPGSPRAGWSAAVLAVADVCRLSNPSFDRDRFLDACLDWETEIEDGKLRRKIQ